MDHYILVAKTVEEIDPLKIDPYCVNRHNVCYEKVKAEPGMTVIRIDARTWSGQPEDRWSSRRSEFVMTVKRFTKKRMYVGYAHTDYTEFYSTGEETTLDGETVMMHSQVCEAKSYNKIKNKQTEDENRRAYIEAKRHLDKIFEGMLDITPSNMLRMLEVHNVLHYQTEKVLAYTKRLLEEEKLLKAVDTL